MIYAGHAGAAGVTRLLSRVSPALPLLTIFTGFLAVYSLQAWGVSTPWLFTDELEFAQLARSVAETGEAARRGESYSFGSLYVFYTAPAWLIDDIAVAYEVAKYLGVVAMTAVVFPTYALARMLVSRRPAVYAAAGAAAVPAFMYSGMLIEEPLAYTYSTLALFLIVRALAAPTRWTVAAAVVAVVAAPLVRTQLAILPAVLALSTAAFGWSHPRFADWRRRWTRGDWIGAATLLLGAAVLANAFLSHASFSWLVATRAYKDRMLEYGIWAGGALTIGLGILPVIAGLALLLRARDEPYSRERRAFVTVLAVSVATFGFYTAVKGAYLSTVFASVIPERNLIYLAPLFFIATAVWLERRTLRPAALAAAAVVVALVIGFTEIQLSFPYFEAPGFAILAAANRTLELPHETIETLLLGAVAAAAALLAVPLGLRRYQGLVVGAAAALVLAWNVTGQLYASSGSRDSSDLLMSNFPQPPNWVDNATRGARTVYLGQQIKDPTGIWLLEFWNRSIERVWSLDGTAPGPGPVITPDLAAADGRLYPPATDADYVLADVGVNVAAPVVSQRGNWRLYELDGPLRLRNAVTGLFPDGWMSSHAAYNQFVAPAAAGPVRVTVSRGGWALPARVTVRVGRLVVGPDSQPALGKVVAVHRGRISGETPHTFEVETPPPPFRVEVRVEPTFVPREVDPRIGDARHLGALVDFALAAA